MTVSTVLHIPLLRRIQIPGPLDLQRNQQHIVSRNNSLNKSIYFLVWSKTYDGVDHVATDPSEFYSWSASAGISSNVPVVPVFNSLKQYSTVFNNLPRYSIIFNNLMQSCPYPSFPISSLTLRINSSLLRHSLASASLFVSFNSPTYLICSVHCIRFLVVQRLRLPFDPFCHLSALQSQRTHRLKCRLQRFC